MKHIFVDTNIVFDLLAKREEFYKEAQSIFTAADRNSIKLYVSALTIANIHYFLTKIYNDNEARKILIRFKVLVQVLPMDDKILDLALSSDFKDFEDAIQYFTALDNKADIILTRNKKDFKHSKLPVFSAREYLKTEKH